MKASSVRAGVVVTTITLYSFAASTVCAQGSAELDSKARSRIEQARASIVVVTIENEGGQLISRASGFFIRKDLVATDNRVVVSGSRVRVSLAGKESAVKVLSPGTYFLPYLLVASRPDVSPLELGDSDKIAVNDKVYMFTDSDGAVSSGTVTGTSTIKDSRIFLISIPVNSSNRGEPVFNGKGDVIGIAAESTDGKSVVFPSSRLALLKHLGEPGGGMGMGTGPGLPSYGPGSGPPRYNEPSRPVERDPNAPATSVDTRPVLLTHIAPRYTEVARKNQVQGSVTMRVLVGADGEVKQIRITRGLPDGLDDQAIAAVRQSKFKPATKDGQAVPFWLLLSVEFNLR